MRELSSVPPCSRKASALRGTLSRLARAKPPSPSGKTIVVDLPSQHLTAYAAGRPVLESRVVVGDPGWRTPDLDTSAVFVRYNPTWTVPESIVEARNWRTKLARNPSYFERLDFLVELGGRMVEPAEAAVSASRTGRFVQQPGPGNALGKVKIGLANSGGVYLHDTNDQGAFDEDRRALSHGCVRVEEAVALSAWALDISPGEAAELQETGDRTDRRLPSPVRVVTTYFTAWPDEDGAVQYYPDVYGREAAGTCAASRDAPSPDYLPDN